MAEATTTESRAGKGVTPPSARFPLLLPVLFFGGSLFLGLWALNGNRLFAPFEAHEQSADR